MNNKTKLTVTTIVALAIASASAQASSLDFIKTPTGMGLIGGAVLAPVAGVGILGGLVIGGLVGREVEQDATDARQDKRIKSNHEDINQLGEYVSESPWSSSGAVSAATTTQATNKQVSDWRTKCIPQGNGGI